jgi:hypothetical protein
VCGRATNAAAFCHNTGELWSVCRLATEFPMCCPLLSGVTVPPDLKRIVVGAFQSSEEGVALIGAATMPGGNGWGFKSGRTGPAAEDDSASRGSRSSTRRPAPRGRRLTVPGWVNRALRNVNAIQVRVMICSSNVLAASEIVVNTIDYRRNSKTYVGHLNSLTAAHLVVSRRQGNSAQSI